MFILIITIIIADTCNTTLPNEVCILPSTIPGADLGVFCATEIAAGTKMGPYTGKILAKCPDAKCSVSTNAWEVGFQHLR